MKEIRHIWLIDDSVASNLLNHKMIESIAEGVQVKSFNLAQEALKELSRTPQQVDLIILDLNMPAMDGWDFIDEYILLKKAVEFNCRLLLLSTSLNPEDEERAHKIEEIELYLQKPLKKEDLKEILTH